MSLSSSLFTGTSGLKNMGNALQVTGNNIANLNTVGYKKGRATFADTLYENVATQGGTDQVGRGMSVGDVSQNFAQGSFESTGNTTDLSIGGDGFFVMRQSGTQNTFYTRAGNFFFNKEGELVNPEGYVVQGWGLDEETGDDVGSINDIVLKAFTNPPKTSTEITAITNLDADSQSKSRVLSNNWDSGEDTYMASNNYEYQTVVKVYDALGSTHDVSIYYDKKSGTEWEYIITCNPEEDQRDLVQGTDSEGLLAKGTILFSQSSGDILDLTMSKFTGRLGNFEANGVNTTDSIHYDIINYDELASDGYGFDFEFDGSSWDFVDIDNTLPIGPQDKPPNYPFATVVYSDDQEIRLVLNSTTETDPDLIIKLDQAAVAGDTFGFDINDPNSLHLQKVDGTSYFGDTATNNTEFEINDPSVMTTDSSGLGLIWNPNAGANNAGKWFWSNPAVAEASGTLLSASMTDSAGAAVAMTTAATWVIDNVGELSMVAEDINVRYDGGSGTWDWNDDVKAADFTNVYSFASSNTPSMAVVAPGTEGAYATVGTPKLFWLGTEWSLSSAAVAVTSSGVANEKIVINTTASTETNVVFDIWYGTAAGASTGAATIEYTFGSELTAASAGQSIAFTMDPTPNEEYSEATIVAGAATSGANAFGIDFNGDNIRDITINPTAGMLAFAAGNDYNYTFDTDPDVPPAEYANATLKGDQTEAIIDLDGSGNESDNDDIRFVFANSLSSAVNTSPYLGRSEIDFNILGSTAWTQIDKNDIEQTGYYSFTTDFLGGDYGTTETDIKLDLGTMFNGINFENDSLSTTQYAKSSSTVFQDANGYSAGDLQGVDVASDGIITGIYSNGQLIPLFRVGLAKFLNNYGLNSEGGNLYSETRDSGSAITNKPGENGLGTIAPNSLEMSNVDISEEFVALITNQRGFQANSKTITTVDDMMSTVIQMKR